MKKTLSFILAVLMLVLALPMGAIATAAGDEYKQLSQFAGEVWQDGNKASVGHTLFTPSKDYMAAAGYTIEADGSYDFSGSLLIEETTVNGIKENAKTFGFMVLERKSGTILYPAAKAEFKAIENTALNRTAETSFTGSLKAKKGDELVFLVKGELSDKTPSLQVVAEIGKTVGDKHESVTANYTGFSDTQGKNGWRFYSVSAADFKMPKLSPDATAEITDGFAEMKYFSENWWWVNSQGKNSTSSAFYGMAIGTHTQPAAPEYMTARGFTIEKEGTVSFSGTVLLDINKNMGIPEGADTIGFMVIEKNSNTVLYPSDSADFVIFKNTEQNRKTPTMIGGTFEARAGDEILFITRNETKGLRPSVQVIMDVYSEKDGKKEKLGNTHEGLAGTQGKNGWKYYYASASTFKTPSVPAKPIFTKATYFDTETNAWYLMAEAKTEQVIASHGASVKKDAVALTAKTGTAIGYKAAESGKVDFSFKHSAFEGGAKVGFSVVKKSTLEQIYPEKKGFKTLAAGAETLTGSFNAAKGDEYLFVFAMQGKGANVSIPTELSVGGATLSGKLSKEQGSPFSYYFATTENIYAELLGSKMPESPYVSADIAGAKNVVFDPFRVTQFDEKKWMWSVSDWENPASSGFMALHMENCSVSTPNYSMVRSYTAQSDCTISVYGNLFSEIPDVLGDAPSGKNLDFMVCNSKGQILFPEDRTGFYTFSESELSASNPILLNVSADIKEGEKVYLVFRNRSGMPYAYIYNHFSIFETPVGENPSVPVSGVSDGFSDTQGNNGWNYYFVSNDSYRFVEATELEKLPGSTTNAPADKEEQKEEKDEQKQENGSKTVYLVLFIVSAVLDLLAVAALVAFIILKIKKQKQTADGEETPQDDK